MALLKLTGFAGEMPKIIPRLLSDNYAQAAFNTRLNDGGLTPIRKPRFVQQLADPPVDGFGTIYKHGEEWLSWHGRVYPAQGPVAADRLYIMGDGAPKMLIGADTYPLAVPMPPTPLTATASGTATSDLGSNRVYVFTWVTGFGEESEPCPASNDVYWKPGQTVTLSGFTSPPAGRNITTQRIYRSQTSTTGTQLYFIAERAASAADFVDTIAPEAINEPIPSVDWNAPPADLTGLIAGPNGMMAAFRGKQVYFCEPYRPHAWPEKYVLTTDYPVVGLAWFSGSIAIVTTGVPYIATGTAPENMVMQKTEQNLPCINQRGIVDLGFSIVYPSYDGLVQVSNSGAQVVSTNLFAREDWMKFNPATMVAGQYNGRYFTTYDYLDVKGQELMGSFIIDLTGEQPFLIRTNYKPNAMHYDIPSGALFMLIGDSIYEWDNLAQPYELQAWRSKLFIIPQPTSFGAILIETDEGLDERDIAAIEAEAERIMAENATFFDLPSIGGEVCGAAVNVYEVNGDMMQPIPTVNRNVTVSIYADQKLVASVGMVNKMARLPGGFKSAKWEVEVSSDLPITQITMATTGQELKGA